MNWTRRDFLATGLASTASPLSCLRSMPRRRSVAHPWAHSQKTKHAR